MIIICLKVKKSIFSFNRLTLHVICDVIDIAQHPYQRNGVVWEVWGKESDLLGSHCHAPKLCLWLELFIVRFTYRKRFTNQALKGITNRRINRETKRYFLPFTELKRTSAPTILINWRSFWFRRLEFILI